MNCRLCGETLQNCILDLGTSPPSNALLSEADLPRGEVHYPLQVYVCERCWLVQLGEIVAPSSIFNATYAYFSSFSSTWLEHAKRYAEMMVSRFTYDKSTFVCEVASNDGYLLQYFLPHVGKVLGIEPAKNTADVARSKGIETITEFFGEALARRLCSLPHGSPKLIVCNNVLAHVPDMHDFVSGLSAYLAPDGVVTFEFPHLLRLLDETQFDTVYHEHFSYLSLRVVEDLLLRHGLRVFDVEKLFTHGGSLRVFACHENQRDLQKTTAVDAVLEEEAAAGLFSLQSYRAFESRVCAIKNSFLEFLLSAKHQGLTVMGYGAAAKASTLLNYSRVRKDFVKCIADASPHKQGKYVPGCRIPVVTEAAIRNEKPSFVVIFPWNLTREISSQLSYIREWGGRFVRMIPHKEVF